MSYNKKKILKIRKPYWNIFMMEQDKIDIFFKAG